MKKVLIMALCFLVLIATDAVAQYKYRGSGQGVTTSSDCSSYIAVGQLCQDTDDGKLYKGNGTSAEEITGTVTDADANTYADIADKVVVANSTDAACFIAFFDAATGNMAVKTNTAFGCNATTGAISATTFVGALTGNADTATALATLGTANQLYGMNSAGTAGEWKATINIQMDDSAAQFKDATDATKTMQIELGSITTGTKRTMTVPDADFTPAGLGLDNAFTGANTLGDGGDDIRLVMRLNATNERWSGSTIYFAQCAATMGFGQPAYIQSTGKPGLADADAAATMPAIGLVVVASTDADTPCTILTHGIITDTDWNWTVGNTIYVADGDAGAVTATIADISDTNDVVQVIGIAVHADSIFVSPSLTTVVLE